MSGSATDINQNNVSKLSHSDLGIGVAGSRKQQPASIIPKTYVQLKDDRRADSTRSRKLTDITSPRTEKLNLNKTLELTIHRVKM